MGREDNELDMVVELERKTVHDQIYQHLRTAIMSGRFPPGMPLSNRQLASAMGTSVMPVREALRRLVAEGAIAVLPNRTFAIPQISPERLQDLRNVRTTLEGFAAAEAARRISRKQIERLEEINSRMKVEADQNPEAYFALNKEFHFTLYQAAESLVAMPLIQSLWVQYGPFLHLIFREGRSTVTLDRHDSALRALRAGDPVGAEAAIRGDIDDAAELILVSVRRQAV